MQPYTLNPELCSYDQILRHKNIDPGSEKSVLKLHLGCGNQYMPGYINIDFPPSEHTVMEPNCDFFSDIMDLNFIQCCCSEIRLHHVFEHFSRVQALALLIRWQAWLTDGGMLYIETPDFEFSATQIFNKNLEWKARMAHLRNLTGGQAAPWAFHKDLWFQERYFHVLPKLGYGDIYTQHEIWNDYPYLCDLHIMAHKVTDFDTLKFRENAKAILWESTVNDNFKDSYVVWVQELEDILNG